MAALSSYTPIATYTIPTAVNSYTFSSVPSTYTDLQLVISGTLSSGATMQLVFNGDTTNVYSGTALYGDGTSAYSVARKITLVIRLGLEMLIQRNFLQ